MIATVIRKAHFNAAHRLHRKDWSEAKNNSVFGKCNNPNFHGHNYDLEVEISGHIDIETGYVMDLKKLKVIIDHEVCDRYDHKNLNLDLPEFRDLNPTAENIVVEIWNRLRKAIGSEYEIAVRLYETPRNSVFYKGE